MRLTVLDRGHRLPVQPSEAVLEAPARTSAAPRQAAAVGAALYHYDTGRKVLGN